MSDPVTSDRFYQSSSQEPEHHRGITTFLQEELFLNKPGNTQSLQSVGVSTDASSNRPPKEPLDKVMSAISSYKLPVAATLQLRYLTRADSRNRSVLSLS